MFKEDYVISRSRVALPRCVIDIIYFIFVELNIIFIRCVILCVFCYAYLIMIQNHTTTPFIAAGSSVGPAEKRVLSNPNTLERDGALRGGIKHTRTYNSYFIDDFAEDIIDASMLSIDIDLPDICIFQGVQSVIQTGDASIAQGS